MQYHRRWFPDMKSDGINSTAKGLVVQVPACRQCQTQTFRSDAGREEGDPDRSLAQTESAVRSIDIAPPRAPAVGEDWAAVPNSGRTNLC